MAKMNLVEGHMFKGKTYGPGNMVELPDDEKFVAKVKDVETRAVQELQAQAQSSMSQLPSGHPYLRLLGVMSGQPPAFDGEATRIAPGPLSNLSDLEAEAIDALGEPDGAGATSNPVSPPPNVRVGSGSATVVPDPASPPATQRARNAAASNNDG